MARGRRRAYASYASLGALSLNHAPRFDATSGTFDVVDIFHAAFSKYAAKKAVRACGAEFADLERVTWNDIYTMESGTGRALATADACAAMIDAARSKLKRPTPRAAAVAEWLRALDEPPELL